MDSAQSEWLCRELGYVLSAAAAEFNEKQPTLRDQFAVGAMQGLLAGPEAHRLSYEGVTQEAYRIADEMLKAREPKVKAA